MESLFIRYLTLFKKANLFKVTTWNIRKADRCWASICGVICWPKFISSPLFSQVFFFCFTARCRTMAWAVLFLFHKKPLYFLKSGASCWILRLENKTGQVRWVRHTSCLVSIVLFLEFAYRFSRWLPEETTTKPWRVFGFLFFSSDH